MSKKIRISIAMNLEKSTKTGEGNYPLVVVLLVSVDAPRM